MVASSTWKSSLAAQAGASPISKLMNSARIADIDGDHASAPYVPPSGTMQPTHSYNDDRPRESAVNDPKNPYAPPATRVADREDGPQPTDSGTFIPNGRVVPPGNGAVWIGNAWRL